MKNIFIIPTDQPSRLGRFIDTNNLLIRVSNDIPRGENVNIYITSDETTKCEAFWHYNNIFNTIAKEESAGYKKIILTTDQDLIKDGVQSINDNFLQWFVNNPSCEEVKIKSYYETLQDGLTFDRIEYKIIIPKEEHKQKWEVFFDEQGKLKIK